jgi:hypothetical protein
MSKQGLAEEEKICFWNCCLDRMSCYLDSLGRTRLHVSGIAVQTRRGPVRTGLQGGGGGGDCILEMLSSHD